MKFLKIFILLCAILFASAAPASEGDSIESIEEEVGRDPRLTCAAKTWIGDSLCIGHCLAIGFSTGRNYVSGYCDSRNICRCVK